MIRHESVITALIGAALGLGLGTGRWPRSSWQQVAPAALAPGLGAVHVHADRRARGDRRGLDAGPPRVEARRAEGAQL